MISFFTKIGPRKNFTEIQVGGRKSLGNAALFDYYFENNERINYIDIFKISTKTSSFYRFFIFLYLIFVLIS